MSDKNLKEPLVKLRRIYEYLYGCIHYSPPVEEGASDLNFCGVIKILNYWSQSEIVEAKNKIYSYCRYFRPELG